MSFSKKGKIIISTVILINFFSYGTLCFSAPIDRINKKINSNRRLEEKNSTSIIIPLWRIKKDSSYQWKQLDVEKFKEKASRIKKEIEMADCAALKLLKATQSAKGLSESTEIGIRPAGGAENAKEDFRVDSVSSSNRENKNDEPSLGDLVNFNKNEVEIIRAYNELALYAFGKVKGCGRIKEEITLPGNPVTPPPPPGSGITALEELRKHFLASPRLDNDNVGTGSGGGGSNSDGVAGSRDNFGPPEPPAAVGSPSRQRGAGSR